MAADGGLLPVRFPEPRGPYPPLGLLDRSKLPKVYTLRSYEPWITITY